MELLCPAGSLVGLRKAIDNGADAVYMGLRDDTNARHFPGLNFTDQQMQQGLRYARDKGARVLLAVNTYAQPRGWTRWQRAVDQAADLGADALIAADLGVLDYAARRHPGLALHLSVQGSATSAEALRFYQDYFGIRRAVLPRVLSMAQVQALAESTDVELEVFAFGSLCVMVEGRCLLSSYVTGCSPNRSGACSPASAVRWQETPRGLESRLNGVLIDRFQDDEQAGYPVVCKGRFRVDDRIGHVLEAPTSLNTLGLLPELMAAGISAVKIEGRQRSPAYVAQVARIWRQAIDACQADRNGFRPREDWMSTLAELSEGAQTTLGAYHRSWQ
ncbi:ubiquinone anaerobic biosynthesis protein UbiU [Alkalilimnicola ehrlichii MLHE-1]|uniref:Ubiquinone biosynthesis protein UbiU n=1 Tax=Alkalilimnicola ehrlichii (strain ATCC BAA-1101 / DSM 17681 / MLHE-1) TaxID=187272 RepID=Q0A6Q9_ALKEH|nr:peptidase U32 family protein [Alkalilimnicola ehrlichii]ABI57478.1 peptidase U32 [Alkalilimnicola ehrlichii MLHE-1]